MCFPVNFEKFQGITSLQNTFDRQLLMLVSWVSIVFPSNFSVLTFELSEEKHDRSSGPLQFKLL